MSKASKNKTVKCCAITKANNQCIRWALEEYNNKYCEQHRDIWLTRNDNDNNIIRCNSSRQCPTSKNGLKAELEEGTTSNLCKDCLENYNKWERKSRLEVAKNNAISEKNNTDTRRCPKCPITNNIHHISKMGKTSKGIISTKCKIHFEQQQEIERRRVRDRS